MVVEGFKRKYGIYQTVSSMRETAEQDPDDPELRDNIRRLPGAEVFDLEDIDEVSGPTIRRALNGVYQATREDAHNYTDNNLEEILEEMNDDAVPILMDNLPVPEEGEGGEIGELHRNYESSRKALLGLLVSDDYDIGTREAPDIPDEEKEELEESIDSYVEDNVDEIVEYGFERVNEARREQGEAEIERAGIWKDFFSVIGRPKSIFIAEKLQGELREYQEDLQESELRGYIARRTRSLSEDDKDKTYDNMYRIFMGEELREKYGEEELEELEQQEINEE